MIELNEGYLIDVGVPSKSSIPYFYVTVQSSNKTVHIMLGDNAYLRLTDSDLAYLRPNEFADTVDLITNDIWLNMVNEWLNRGGALDQAWFQTKPEYSFFNMYDYDINDYDESFKVGTSVYIPEILEFGIIIKKTFLGTFMVKTESGIDRKYKSKDLVNTDIKRNVFYGPRYGFTYDDRVAAHWMKQPLHRLCKWYQIPNTGENGKPRQYVYLALEAGCIENDPHIHLFNNIVDLYNWNNSGSISLITGRLYPHSRANRNISQQEFDVAVEVIFDIQKDIEEVIGRPLPSSNNFEYRTL